MNPNLLLALSYVELAKMQIEKANKVLWLDHTVDEVNKMLQNLRDDVANESKRLNLRVIGKVEVEV